MNYYAASPVQMKTYRASSQVEATAEFQRDAAMAWNAGYQPVAQQWEPPDWAPKIVLGIVIGLIAGFVAAVMLVVFAGIVLGILVAIIFPFVERPSGTLIVTYARR